jgi:predicted chitinase
VTREVGELDKLAALAPAHPFDEDDLLAELRDGIPVDDVAEGAAILTGRPAARYAYRLGWRSVQRVVGGPKVLSNARARVIADALGPAFHEHGITTRRRAAMAVAQMAEESACFRATTEFASGAAYEGRRDLGNTHGGDGKRFKGRGFIMLTGRANYTAASKALRPHGDPAYFVKHPEAVAEPAWAAKVSCWWWEAHGLNGLADKGDVTACTRRINGGTNGLSVRKTFYRRAWPLATFLVPRRRKP